MTEYVWQHDLKHESDRLRLMSDLLDPSSSPLRLPERLEQSFLELAKVLELRILAQPQDDQWRLRHHRAPGNRKRSRSTAA
jgi:hypothetical protein